MRKWDVYVTRRIPDAGLAILDREIGGYSMNPRDRRLSREELVEACRGRDGILCLLTDRFDAEVIKEIGDRCRVIANYAVGFDNIDVAAASAAGIVVTNTPGVLTETTADLTWALLMAVARRVCEADRFVRAGRFSGWDPMLLLGSDVHGKTLGLVGAGRIGEAVGRRAAGFSMKILYCDAVRCESLDAMGAERLSLDDLLARADFVSIHVPLTPETKGMIDRRRLKAMKAGAYLINTSRGPVIDEAALAEALRDGPLAGAALDVYENEPAINPSLLELENVVLAPHIGSASRETRGRMAEMAAENIVAVLKGREAPNPVPGSPRISPRR
jgi:glyoxylate reductase